MTTLAITPNWQKKTAKFKGTVAAGELVAVTIQNDGGFIADTQNLRLRVVDKRNGDTLAQFPEGESAETWSPDTTPLSCVLDLRTDRMMAAVPPASTVPFLFVLDDPEDDEETLYFKDECEITHWPQRIGEDNPKNLRGYRDFVDETRAAVAEAQAAIESAVDEATGIVAQATEAKDAADGVLQDVVNYATSAGNAASAAGESASDAQAAQTAAETAQGKAEAAQAAAEAAQAAAEAALPLDDTLSEDGKAADAKAVGDALAEKQDALSEAQIAAVDSGVTAEAFEGLQDDVAELENGKAARPPSTTNGNFAALDGNGDLKDSGKRPDDFTPASHAENENIHVTTQEKTAWSAKQNAISDLASIRAGAALGATAIQQHQDISGKADLVDGKVPSGQLPSYVDDVIEVADYASLPETGEQGKIYVAVDTNITYRWSGTQYVEIASPVEVVAPDSATTAGQAADALATKNALNAKTQTIAAHTWSEVVAMRNGGLLAPGASYRITDYVATTNGDGGSQSAGHPFDIIVTADTPSSLNEKAAATPHAGDTHLSASNLAIWQVWYCLDNDTSRFAWADTTSGKGVVFRLVDEFGNDCPYDFKGLVFERWAISGVASQTFSSDDFTDFLKALKYDTSETLNGGRRFAYGYTAAPAPSIRINSKNMLLVDSSSSSLHYTFDTGSGADASLDGYANGVYCNTIAECIDATSHKRILNNIVFLGEDCFSNAFAANCDSFTLGKECRRNTFGCGCNCVIFGNGCRDNTLGDVCEDVVFGYGCSVNAFGRECTGNILCYACSHNVFAHGCYSNTFGNQCSINIFGDGCFSNAFRANSSFNTFGEGCSENSFGADCSANTFRDKCKNNRFGSASTLKDRYQRIIFQDGVQYVTLNCTAERTNNETFQRIEVRSGVKGSAQNRKLIESDDCDQGFHTIYKPAGSKEVSV